MTEYTVYSFPKDSVLDLLKPFGCTVVRGGKDGDFTVATNLVKFLPKKGRKYVRYVPTILHEGFLKNCRVKGGKIMVDLFRLARSVLPYLTFEEYQKTMERVFNRPNCDNMIIAA